MNATASRNTQLAAMPMMIESRTTIGKRNGQTQAEQIVKVKVKAE